MQSTPNNDFSQDFWVHSDYGTTNGHLTGKFAFEIRLAVCCLPPKYFFEELFALGDVFSTKYVNILQY
jgi:hypothetical protein